MDNQIFLPVPTSTRTFSALLSCPGTYIEPVKGTKISLSLFSGVNLPKESPES